MIAQKSGIEWIETLREKMAKEEGLDRAIIQNGLVQKKILNIFWSHKSKNRPSFDEIVDERFFFYWNERS